MHRQLTSGGCSMGCVVFNGGFSQMLSGQEYTPHQQDCNLHSCAVSAEAKDCMRDGEWISLSFLKASPSTAKVTPSTQGACIASAWAVAPTFDWKGITNKSSEFSSDYGFTMWDHITCESGNFDSCWVIVNVFMYHKSFRNFDTWLFSQMYLFATLLLKNFLTRSRNIMIEKCLPKHLGYLGGLAPLKINGNLCSIAPQSLRSFWKLYLCDISDQSHIKSSK